MAQGRNRCPDCGSANLAFFPEKGELVCTMCGTVIQEHMIDLRVEYRVFSPDQREKRSRIGGPLSDRVHDRGLSTIIDWHDKDFTGKALPYKARLRARKLRRLQKNIRISSNRDRKMVSILTRIHRVASNLGLPSQVEETAGKIARRAVNSGIVRGRVYETYVAAILYLACRYHKIPRTLDEISKLSGAPKKDVATVYRKLVGIMLKKPPLSKPTEYIPRLASSLKLSGEVQYKAAEVLRAAVEMGLSSGRGPVGLAAASIYLASVILDEKRTQKDIAEIANVTEVTVRNRYKDLVENFDIVVEL